VTYRRPDALVITLTRCITLVFGAAVAAFPLRGQQPSKADSAQFAQMQGMMGPMMEQMMTATMTATLRVLARPESARQLATFVKNFYQALLAKGFSKEDPLRIVAAVGMPHAGAGR
jgi:hypothetical protein